MLHYFLLILLNLLNNVILYQLWWDAKCLYEVQIPKCDWCSIGSQCTNIYGDLWREWEGVLFLGSNSGEDLQESIYRLYAVLHGLLIQMQNMRHGKKAKFWNFFFLLSLIFPSFFCISCLMIFFCCAYIVILVSFISVGNVFGKAFRILG